jgi:hypothetical protein
MNTSLEAMIFVSENHGADERPISFGDSTILFIRLTFANADDDFKWRKSVASTSATACAESRNAKAARYGQHKKREENPMFQQALEGVSKQSLVRTRTYRFGRAVQAARGFF